MKPFISLLIVVTCLLTIVACNNAAPGKEKSVATDKSPASTVSGVGTDGVYWKLSGKDMSSVSYRCSWINSGSTNIFNVTAYWEKPERGSFMKSLNFNIYNFKPEVTSYEPSETRLDLANKDPNFSLTINLHQDDFNGIYTVRKSKGGGEITITKIDTVNQLVSGSFHGVMTGHDGKQFEISDGRFENLHCKIIHDLSAEMEKAKEVLKNIDIKEVEDKVKEMEKKSDKH